MKLAIFDIGKTTVDMASSTPYDNIVDVTTGLKQYGITEILTGENSAVLKWLLFPMRPKNLHSSSVKSCFAVLWMRHTVLLRLFRSS